jgi:hypothetical protein
MTVMQLKRLQEKIESLRAKGTVKAREVESIAKSLQRRLVKPGKHPHWESIILANRPPISIPHHSKELNRITAGKILDQLEEDVIELLRRTTDHEEPTDDDETPNER